MTADQGGACGAREPGGTIRPMVSGRAEGGAEVEPTGQGGVMRSAAGSTFLVEASNRKTQGFSTQQCVRVKDEGLKGTSEDGAEGLAGC